MVGQTTLGFALYVRNLVLDTFSLTSLHFNTANISPCIFNIFCLLHFSNSLLYFVKMLLFCFFKSVVLKLSCSVHPYAPPPPGKVHDI